MDFQFGPSSEEYENPEKNLSGIVHTPGVTDFSSPHSLGAEAPLKPDIEGGALAGLGAPKKPTLHVGEVSPHPTDTASLIGKTATGGSVEYIYDYPGQGSKPLAAHEYSEEGGWLGAHNPEHVEFPPAPISKPALPTLHIGEPEHVGGGTTWFAKTPEGGTLFYNYNVYGKPIDAELYDVKGNQGKTFDSTEIAFPKFSSLKKTEFEDTNVPEEPTVHEHYATQFAHYKDFDGDKPELELTSPLKLSDYKDSMGYDVAKAFGGEGEHIKFLYDGHKPVKAILYLHSMKQGEFSPDQINFPQHPLEQVAWTPEKPTLHTGELKPAGSTLMLGKTSSGNDIAYAYKDDLSPDYAETYDLNNNVLSFHTPDQINFPKHPNQKSGITLSKVNLASEYPEEKPIEELYQPSKPSHYPEAHFSSELSSAEIRSIHEYTGSYYHQINSYVRRKSNLNEDDFERDNHHEAHMANLDSAIAKASLPEATTVYRGISANLFGKFSSRLEPGETILHQNYMSTTSRHGFAKGWKGGHTMVIETPAGTHALPVEQHSSNSGENEILFPRDTKLKLIKKSHNTLYFEVVP